MSNDLCIHTKTLEDGYRQIDAAIEAARDPHTRNVLLASRAVVPPFMDWIDPRMRRGEIDNGQACILVGALTSTLVATFLKTYVPAHLQPKVAAMLGDQIATTIIALANEPRH